MMTRAALEERLADREGVGPLGSFEGLREDLARLIAELGEAGASILVDSVMEHTEATIYGVATLLEVIEAYAKAFPAALAAAAIGRLRPDGPPLLVTTIGLGGDASLVQKLHDTLDTSHATPELLSSIADAVIDTEAKDSTDWLDELLARSDVGGQARTDLETARAHLSR